MSSHPKRAGEVDDDDGEEWLEVHVERLGSDKVLVGFLERRLSPGMKALQWIGNCARKNVYHTKCIFQSTFGQAESWGQYSVHVS